MELLEEVAYLLLDTNSIAGIIKLLQFAHDLCHRSLAVATLQNLAAGAFYSDGAFRKQ